FYDGDGDGIAQADIGAYEMRSYRVETTADTSSGPGGLSLRDAIQLADRDSTSVIIFADNVRGAINLQSPLPALTGAIGLRGPGAGQLTVRRGGSGLFGVFEVATGADVTISGLTIADGLAFNGGGIINRGTLTLVNS